MNGEKQAPLYKSLKSSKSRLFRESIKWNFTKFLVDREGNVVERFSPATTPLSIEVKLVVSLPMFTLYYRFAYPDSLFCSRVVAEEHKAAAGRGLNR